MMLPKPAICHAHHSSEIHTKDLHGRFSDSLDDPDVSLLTNHPSNQDHSWLWKKNFWLSLLHGSMRKVTPKLPFLMAYAGSEQSITGYKNPVAVHLSWEIAAGHEKMTTSFWLNTPQREQQTCSCGQPSRAKFQLSSKTPEEYKKQFVWRSI